MPSLGKITADAKAQSGIILGIQRRVYAFQTVVTAIAAALSDMDAELAGLQSRRDKTRNLKQAMMQELLTGKTRLVSAGAAHA